MILLDANLLLYASVSDFSQHTRARRWFEDQVNGLARVGLPWMSLVAFLRISTNARVFPRPLPIEDAWSRVVEWLNIPVVWTPTETDRHAEVFGTLLRAAGATDNVVPDAHLAAIAIEHGLVLCSTDRDFARFRGLRWENPLQPD